MSQLTIYKASAGSGKTYRLVVEYLKLLVANPYNYRHVLAVTFTNKATAEMKERILRDLYAVSIQADEKMMQTLKDETGISETKILVNAQLALANILHDYDRFSISTIDSFFQRILRSFARETGLYGTYEVELDQDAVLEEACDRLLMSVEDDIELRNWLLTMSEDQLGDGKNWRINDKILELGKELQQEAFQQYMVYQESPEAERAKLKQLKSELQKTRKWFESEIRAFGKRGLDCISAAHLHWTDFSGGSRSFVNYFNHWFEFKPDKLNPTKTMLAAADDTEKWLTKKSEKRELIIDCVEGGLKQILNDTLAFIELNSKEYTTAIELYKYIYALGVLTTLSAKVREIGQEKNTLLLSEGNMLLRGIIGNNDAPFVYEKTGTYYRYFMIDEFQDTSVTQWANFKPLVSNSLAENNPNLIVGDVKQSIYRWRNSDWQLLNKHIKQELNTFAIQETALESNWRSSHNVVRFNNVFFGCSRTILQDDFNNDIGEQSNPILEEYKTTILDAYSDVVQKEASSEKGGFIQCEFLDKDKSEYEFQTLDRIIEAIKEVQDKGYKAGDIAILVKKNKQGKKIAEALLNQKKKKEKYTFEVISDDTLFIDSSATVRFIVNLMRFILTPSDQVIQATIVYEFASNILPELIRENKIPPRIVDKGQQQLSFDHIPDKKHYFISDEVQNDYFPFFKKDKNESIDQNWSHLSLVDLTEVLINQYYLNRLPGEQANLQAFKDVVNDFSKRESGNLHKFLEWWNQFGEKVKLQTAGQRDAIRIMTIHKSKGLEFPVVILPFCDWSIVPDSKKTNIMWCETEQTKYNQFPILPVKFSKNIKNSHFSQNYFTETLLSYIDNLNVLYVAQTRAVKGLYLFTQDIEKQASLSISGLIGKVIKSNVDNLSIPQKVTESVYSCGELKLKKGEEIKTEKEVNLSESISTHQKIGEALRLRKNYDEFLDEKKNSKIVKVNQGKIIHEILSFIDTESNIEKALFKMRISGKIEEGEIESYRKQLTILFSNSMAKNWFNGTFNVLNETTIIEPGFVLTRPDRVMIQNEKVVIVDYKATDKVNASHQRQVQGYIDTVERVGYSNVEGYVWYLKSNQILNVENDY
ncbi:MAG: UvrD-helicase domain-containing protein [Prolixibacteraceae bacterium]|jgi:ATP-dependent helicase/nuclease subunit A|nr:UvrD-helicase domain-containing protein [Prolixibacteraceae bacterium]